MKTISIPVNNRPECLRRVLDSVRACPTWREWRIVFSCEPPIRSAIEQLTMAISGDIVSTNVKQLGCWANTYHSAAIAMASGSTLNLYLEDDYLITSDTLDMVTQWDASGLPGVLCLRRPHAAQSDEISVVKTCTTGLFGCGFAWRVPLWPIVRNAWFSSDHAGNYAMWDISICAALQRMGVQHWRPMVNRSYGIGLRGTHTHGDGSDLNLFGPAYSGPAVNKFVFIQ